MVAQYDFELNKEMIYLIETLKVESYWNLKNFALTLQNKDVPFLNYIENIVKNLEINISKRLLLKIRLKDNTSKEEVKLIWKNKELNFHIEKSPFDNNKVKAVTSLPYTKHYDLLLVHRKKEIPIKIKCLKDNILANSEIDCWMYKDLRFPTKKLLNFLEEYCGGNKNIQVEEYLLNANSNIVMSAFSALIDCEGSINWYGLRRVIRIRMRNHNYLKQWSNLLKKHNIRCKLRKNSDKEYEITIYGWHNFDRLNRKGFKLYHSKKAKRWIEIMKGFKRNQISRNSYRIFYVNKLKEIDRKITSKEFAEYLNKSKRVIDHYLSKLAKEKLVLKDKGSWPYLYFISTSSVR